MKEMMPQMMEGIDMAKMMPKMMMGMMGGGPGGKGECGGMMSKMMTGDKSKGMTMMPDMMMEMMPHCLSVMLPRVPKKKRMEFIRNVVSILMEKGCAGMSDEQKRELFASLVERENAVD